MRTDLLPTLPYHPATEVVYQPCGSDGGYFRFSSLVNDQKVRDAGVKCFDGWEQVKAFLPEVGSDGKVHRRPVNLRCTRTFDDTHHDGTVEQHEAIVRVSQDQFVAANTYGVTFLLRTHSGDFWIDPEQQPQMPIPGSIHLPPCL